MVRGSIPSTALTLLALGSSCLLDIPGRFDPDGDGGSSDGDIVHDVGTLELDLLAALYEAKAMATAPDGRALGRYINVIDMDLMAIVDGERSLADAPAETVDWVGGVSSVTVVCSINGAQDEDPIGGDGEWFASGFLVRGVRLTSSGNVEVPSTLSVDDMNLFNATENGAFSESVDYATPEDVDVHAQIAGAAEEIKRVIRETFLR